MKIGFNFMLVNTCFIDRPHVDEAGKVTGYLVPVLIRDEFEPDEEEHGGRFSLYSYAIGFILHSMCENYKSKVLGASLSMVFTL
jgi:hypothetical protein